MIAGLILSVIELVGRRTGRRYVEIAGTIGTQFLRDGGIEVPAGATGEEILGRLIGMKNLEVENMVSTGRARREALEDARLREGGNDAG